MKTSKLQQLAEIRYKLKGIDPDNLYSLRESFNLDAKTGQPILKQETK